MSSNPAAAKIQHVEHNPEAHLDDRPGDIDVPHDRLAALRDAVSLFHQLASKISLEKFPGSLKVRRYAPGDVICRQGEAGWTAFYPLTREDVGRMSAAGFLQRPPPPPPDPKHLLGVHLAFARRAAGPSWKSARKSAAPKFIPIDGPSDIDYETRKSTIGEGELFGEMSCLSRSPRSATIVAEHECVVLEILRNILEQLKKDKKFKERMDLAYKARVFDQQVRNLPLFQSLNDDEVAELRAGVQLQSFKIGEIILEEFDQPDDMFLVRGGLVKVSRGLSALLRPADVLDWDGLARALADMDAQRSPSPWNTFHASLPPVLQRVLRRDPPTIPEELRPSAVAAVNRLIQGKMSGPMAAPGHSLSVSVTLGGILERLRDGDPMLLPLLDRRMRRVQLEAQFPGVFRRYQEPPEQVLAYLSRGDLFGEIAVLKNIPRTATCIAYAHKTDRDTRWSGDEMVEVVRIPGPLFQRLRVSNRDLDRLARDLAAARVQADEELPLAVTAAPEFERLGLAQGQRLLLIDLDRCTRCDECVKACVNTHDDGRSRLFLDGPRFGNYLIPISCRSCRDPVCMIGCPVGAIHRGDNRQMIIEDWCIGCEMCAKQCPYGSIQMHDIGLLPWRSRGWRWLPAEAAGERWWLPSVRDTAWESTEAPMRSDRDWVSAAVRRLPPRARPSGVYCLRTSFPVPAELLDGRHDFELKSCQSDDRADRVELWLNGEPVTTEERVKRPTEKVPSFNRVYPAEALAGKLKRDNLLAVKVSVPDGFRGIFFDVRLDAVPRAVSSASGLAEYTQKAVEAFAVVCDMCSSLPGQTPACVHSCPHEAAMRVDALREFPAET